MGCFREFHVPFEFFQRCDRRLLLAKAGNRFGTYLATSTDKGNTFELPRVISETDTGRGFIDVGVLVPFDDRVVMLFTADVTGTRGRRWYAMATDDGGENWGPP